MKLTKLIMILLLLSVISMAQTVTAPTNLKATIVGPNATKLQAVSLTWEYGQVTTKVGFNIYKRMGALSDTTPFVKIGETPLKTFIDPIEPGKIFSYYVTAVVNKVESDSSNNVEIEIVPPVIAFGKISGNLYDDSSKAPIAKGNVSFIPTTVKPPSMDISGMAVMTDGNGNFTARLRTGDYFIYSSAHGYFGEFYDNVKNIQNATKVTVNAGDSLVFGIGLAKIVPPVNYTVSGWVKDASGNPLKANLISRMIHPAGICHIPQEQIH